LSRLSARLALHRHARWSSLPPAAGGAAPLPCFLQCLPASTPAAPKKHTPTPYAGPNGVSSKLYVAYAVIPQLSEHLPRTLRAPVPPVARLSTTELPRPSTRPPACLRNIDAAPGPDARLPIPTCPRRTSSIRHNPSLPLLADPPSYVAHGPRNFDHLKTYAIARTILSPGTQLLPFARMRTARGQERSLPSAQLLCFLNATHYVPDSKDGARWRLPTHPKSR
jgi:hypothetical protein